MKSFSLHLRGPPTLKCPYKGCGKAFERPTILTDPSTLPRKTFYVCPHCQSKLDLHVEGLKVVDIKAMEYGEVFDSPAKCARYSGFVNAISKDVSVPDDCLVCPKILQCGHKRPQQAFSQNGRAVAGESTHQPSTEQYIHVLKKTPNFRHRYQRSMPFQTAH